MAEKIPQQFIDDLLNRIDIVELIDSYLPLRQAGSNYLAPCPFHTEKTPSFSVSPSKQFYHCFGCGAHGTAIGFLMEHERMSFVDAIEELATRAGLKLPNQNMHHDPTLAAAAKLYPLLEQVAQFYERQLRNHPQAQQAKDYLKGRGVTGEVAKQFKLGFAAPGWDTLLKTLGMQPAAAAQLVETGLLIKRDGGNGCYDRFRNRIMFPIRDHRGRVIGFGGRVLDDETPKYLNSPESAIFHKGKSLYGLFEARQANRQLARLLVVEGYMDVLALAQFGITYSVATLGTAATGEHLERLYRTTSEVVFCFDGDKAGRDAAWRAVQQTLPVLKAGRQTRFMFLPEGEDPDTFIRQHGRDQFEKSIAAGRPLSDFFYDHLSAQIDTTTMEGRARLVELARPMLSKIPDGIYRHMMLTELARRTDVDLSTLQRAMVSGPPAKAARAVKTQQKPGLSPLRLAISLLIQQPSLGKELDDMAWLRELDAKGAKLLWNVLELAQTQPQITTAMLLERWRGTKEGDFLAKLAVWPLLTPTTGMSQELKGALAILRAHHREQRLDTLLHKHLDQLTAEEKIELAQSLSHDKSAAESR